MTEKKITYIFKHDRECWVSEVHPCKPWHVLVVDIIDTGARDVVTRGYLHREERLTSHWSKIWTQPSEHKHALNKLTAVHISGLYNNGYTSLFYYETTWYSWQSPINYHIIHGTLYYRQITTRVKVHLQWVNWASGQKLNCRFSIPGIQCAPCAVYNQLVCTCTTSFQLTVKWLSCRGLTGP